MKTLMQTKSHLKKGLAPGTPIYVGDRKAENTVIELTQYDLEHLEVMQLSNADVLIEKVKQFKGSQWIRICGLANTELINKICQFFEVHSLVVEDIVNTLQRPKIDYYDHYTHIAFKIRQTLSAEDTVKYDQMSILLFKDIIITFEEQKENIFNNIKERLSNVSSRVRKLSVDYLGYLFLDYVVDDYMCFLEEKVEEVNVMEELVVNQSKEFSLKKLYFLKREVMSLRKVIQPLTDNVNKVIKAEVEFISPSVIIYFRDLYDHCLRSVEYADSCRDIMSTMLDIYLSYANNKTNETIRVLTIFASIFIPLTFIASIYGMNFVNMPELKSPYGYHIVLSVMATIAVVLLALFRKKKWI